jgi:hypothetical protein
MDKKNSKDKNSRNRRSYWWRKGETCFVCGRMPGLNNIIGYSWKGPNNSWIGLCHGCHCRLLILLKTKKRLEYQRLLQLSNIWWASRSNYKETKGKM